MWEKLVYDCAWVFFFASNFLVLLLPPYRAIVPLLPSALMAPWAHQGEFELRLRKGSGAAELLERALAEPRLSYKGVVGALVNALRKAKRKQRCAGACCLTLVRLFSELSGTACRCSPCSAHSAPRLPPSGARKTCSVRPKAVHDPISDAPT